MNRPRTFLWLALALAMMLFASCGSSQQEASTVEAEIIDLNWNYAVKDLYLLDEGAEATNY